MSTTMSITSCTGIVSAAAIAVAGLLTTNAAARTDHPARLITVRAPIIALSGLDDEDDQRVRTRTVVIGHGDDDTKSFGTARRLEVMIDDGDVRVRIDGEDVPAERLEGDGSRIVILDENGNPIETIRIGGQMGDGGDLPFGDFFEFSGDGELWKQLEQFGWTSRDANVQVAESPKVMLGVHLDRPGPALERHLRLEPGTTTLVTAVLRGLPAFASGLEEYDVITRIDGRGPVTPRSLREALAEREPGDLITMSIIHEGEPREIEVRLEAFDPEAMASADVIGELRSRPMALPFGPGSTGVRDLNRFFVDPDERVFFSPRGTIRIERDDRGTVDVEVSEGEPELDPGVEQLDRRLQELEKTLRELVERAESERRR